MGASHSSQPTAASVRAFVFDSVNTTVTNTLVERSTNIDQRVIQSQVIEVVTVEPSSRPCPPGTVPGTVAITNQSSVALLVSAVTQNVDAVALAEGILSKLEAAAAPYVRPKVDGYLAFGTGASSSTKLSLSQRVRNDALSSVQQSLSTFLRQRVEGTQVICTVRIVQSCGANVRITNRSAIEAMATEMSDNVADAVMDTEDVRRLLHTSSPSDEPTAVPQPPVEPLPPPVVLPHRPFPGTGCGWSSVWSSRSLCGG
jgi:hypothetical protein